MGETPRDLTKCKLGELIDLKYGRGLPERERIPGSYPVYGSGGIVGTHNEALVKGPGIIVGRKGSIGNVFFEINDFYPIDTVFYVKLNSKITDLYYLSKLLTQIGFQSMNSDAAVPGLKRESALSIDILVHDLSTQRKIAAILSAYDDLIENNLRRIKILEEMAQNLYREWFVNFRFPGHEQTRFVDSPLGRIPEGWVVKGLIDFGEIITGKTPSKIRLDYYGDDVPFIKLPDMHNNIYCTQTIDNLSKSGADSQKSKTLPPNSLCVSCIGTVGKVAITTFKSQTNQQINSIIPYRRDNLEFLFFSLLGLKEKIELYSATGATMNNLSRGKFISLRAMYPSEKLIKEYHDLVSPNFRAILNLQLKNEVLKKTRDFLLPKLISGEVDVSELDINVSGEEAV